MISREEVLNHLIGIWDGETISPANLENIITSLEKPDTNLEIGHLAQAVIEDLGDIPTKLDNFTLLTPDQILELARRLSWTTNALTKWDKNNIDSKIWIECILASVAIWDFNGDFWRAVYPRLAEPAKALEGCAAVIYDRVPHTFVSPQAPIWEQEHERRLWEADRTRNWKQLFEMTLAFRQLPSSDGGARQALFAIRLFDWLRIIRLAERTDSWIRTYLMLESLSLADALRVAISCRNGYVHFTVIERVTRRETRVLTPEEERYLRNFLIILSKDTLNWPHWLRIFNHYPVRTPHMQVAIGQALAHGDQHAYLAYVESISLDNYSIETEECVERCLSEFKRNAKMKRRCILWRYAFERWQNWNFGIQENNNLTAITRSALDYAVVGWLIEGGEKKTLSDLEHYFEKQFRTFESQWHKSDTAATSGFFRLLSQYQIKRHAVDQSANDLYWLPKSIIYTPEAVDNDFTRAQYGYD